MKVDWVGRDGQPVTTFWGKVWVSLQSFCSVCMGLCLVVFWVLAVLLLWPIYLPLDWLLKRYGRRGFVLIDQHSLSVSFTDDAFRRVA